MPISANKYFLLVGVFIGDKMKKEAAKLNEDYVVENAAIQRLKNLGYSYKHGSELTPEYNERESYRDAILKNRFIKAIKNINPWLTEELALKVYKTVTNIDNPDFNMRGKYFMKC